jgi:4-amino-4-deoxy-L-arabinose transferase-like glycosyltransferase
MDTTVNSKVINTTKWLYILIIVHILLWTLIPALLRHTLPMDALEGFVWGQHWQLGYDRNPWLNAWITHLAVAFGGTSGWLVYLCSQLSVAACFWAVWQLGKEILNPYYALISVFALETIQYYTLAAVDFNDNVLEIGLWALSILFFYRALKNQKIISWLLTGVIAALAMMAKYYTIMLLIPMFGFVLYNKEARKSFHKPGIYLAICTFFLFCLPHCIWLLQNHFATLNYALMRTTTLPTTPDFHSTALYFLLIHLINFLAPLLLLAIFCFGKKSRETKYLAIPTMVNSFDKNYLLTVSFGPLLLTVIFASTTHATLHSMWGTPLMSFWVLALLAFVQPKLTKVKIHTFIIVTSLIFFAILGTYSYAIIYNGYQSSANYPGKKIASYILQKWDTTYKSKPNYVLGSRYTAGNIAYFAPQKIYAYMLDDKTETKIDQTILQNANHNGAIFVWQLDKKEMPDKTLSKIFPRLQTMQTQSFSWERNNDKPPLNVGFAFLPPE